MLHISMFKIEVITFVLDLHMLRDVASLLLLICFPVYYIYHIIVRMYMLFNTLLYAVFHNKSHLVRKQRFVIRQNVVCFFFLLWAVIFKGPYMNEMSHTGQSVMLPPLR